MGGPDAAAAVGAVRELTSRNPYKWQERLLCRWFVEGRIPETVDIPTGLGKTAAIALWLVALAVGSELPRRLIYVVDRRTVVDQASEEAERLAAALGDTDGENSSINELRHGLGLRSRQPLPVSTLRGQHLDNRLWLEDPSAPAIIVGTVDMIGSRLLFGGYGVSPRIRPVHAGLIGADALVMMDEAHLVPPFAALLRSVSEMWASPPVPRFHLMTLSATGRKRASETRKAMNCFGLETEDWDDEPVRARLDAPKRVLIEPTVAPKELPANLADRAWQLSEGGKRVIVYCQRRTLAQEVRAKIDEKAKRNGHAEMTELVVGARRVHEREQLRSSLVFRRFLPDAPLGVGEEGQPAFLVATSAGEVGVDLDADHLVCDLVPWERMVQRFGRVNRRGRPATAKIDVFPAPAEAEIEPEITNDRLAALLAPFDAKTWPKVGGRLDASPGTLHRLKADPELKSLLERATSGEPLRPALTKPLLEAWSMTSLTEHPGRPGIEPWLRGWVKQEPQTRVVWRRLLPVRQYDDADLSRKTLNEFFQSAPPHLSEILETRTSEVVDIVLGRAKALQANRGKEAAAKSRTTGLPLVCAVTLTTRGEVERILPLADLAGLSSKQLFPIVMGRTIVLDAELGGLDDSGLLDPKAETPPLTVDAEDDVWGADLLAAAGFRVVRGPVIEAPEGDWRIEWRWRTVADDDSGDGQEIRVEVLRRGGATSGDAAIAKHAQLLAEHHEWVAREAAEIADRVRLREPYREMLIAAAAAHDAGKARELWQRAMGARRDGNTYAKTEGGGIPALLNGYRHEFGSLRDAQKNNRLGDLPEDLRELALHLIASHHGFARPVIAAIDPEAPPSACAALAREAALRFARLQAQWGVWGLAWWEALLRAADWAASRKLNEDGEKE